MDTWTSCGVPVASARVLVFNADVSEIGAISAIASGTRIQERHHNFLKLELLICHGILNQIVGDFLHDSGKFLEILTRWM
jgi:hypothetical protein